MQIFRTKSVEQTLAETEEEGHSLKRNLGWWDLAVMGVAVAVGAGIFSVGAQAAAFHAGPAVIISFIIAGIVCGAAVMCYAEFASVMPVAGSAYTFTYATLGEIFAWIIGWDLILEMLMAGSVISKFWGVYLNDFLRLMGVNFNTNIMIGSFHLDIAPIVIVAFFTTLLVLGTKIGARVDGAMTVLKIAVVLFVVIVGFFYVKASNYTPFIPPAEPSADVANATTVHGTLGQPLFQWLTHMSPTIYGVPGIISGAALVFFAFIGFDVVATASEETRNPKRNVPLGIGVGMSLIIVMYVLVAIVTTGKHGTPARLQIVVGVVVAIIAACFNIDVLSDMVNIGTLSAFTLVALAIPIMRKRRPDLKRSFRMPGNPWVPLLVALANFYLMLNLTVLTWIRFLIWLVVGFIIYFAYGYNHARVGTGELDAEVVKYEKQRQLKAQRAKQSGSVGRGNDAAVTKVEAGKD